MVHFNDCSAEGMSGGLAARRHGQATEPVLQARVYPDCRDEQSDELEVISLNLSRHGVGLELTRDLTVGNTYQIELGLGAQRLRSNVRITCCDPIAEGLFRAGGEFC